MNNYNFISKTEKALADLIWNGIKNESATQAIITGQDQITFSSPKAAENKKTKKLSMFLYSIIQETSLRNAPIADSAGKTTIQLPFAMRYLVTPITGNDENDHILLETIVQTIVANPIIAAATQENGGDLKLILDSLALDDLSKLWTALDAPLRLSISVTVSDAKLTHVPQEARIITSKPTEAEISDAKHWTELYQKVLRTFMEQTGSVKKRNVFQKQWLSQDFKKVTNMSIEEMHATLNSLGDKLELHLPTAQFIEPLNILAEYYEHQQTQLKEFGKISQKQKENVELVSQWIKDLKALTDALSNQKKLQKHSFNPT